MQASPEENKTDAREARLSLRKANEEVLRIKFMKEARLRCFDYTKAFGECAKVNGLMVVFKCREENRLMNECLNKYCTEAEFEKHMKSLGY